ncbi:MAG: hypothetical protein COX37_03080 [Candidatus Nealsonbacteria bacterium CG23_combo_of_CG06-09_8_20_14_all_39_17]|uniref:Uncharacterized protein n=1 Tax=Candidatus Nealsonbacteria bacterium CG23_combo_of_CG06-09_8_20_14_all_39_17 TaxID=1974722 RepID=A0A2G9YTT8_9BACT|nr:MAG: hypothetical protein COX37_03080 [Candidatus Nealsonbacteria bacterium CG23_combo_of_CG06-09_8_20_14_all_39_17]
MIKYKHTNHMPTLSKEKFWELYKKLPQELQEALFAEETGNNIYDVCEKNDVAEKLSSIVGYTGQVLVGALPAENLAETLEKEVGLEYDLAKKISDELYRFIFHKVHNELDLLYRGGSETETIKKEIEETKIKIEATPTTPSKYREPIE